MRNDKSFGIIPLRKKAGSWEVLLVQLHAGHWGFPKGHPEHNETPQMTARRELQEETGLVFNEFLSEANVMESYIFQKNGEKVSKQVTYFLAEVYGEPTIQKEELLEAKWMQLSKASKQLTFPESKKVCHQVEQFLREQ